MAQPEIDCKWLKPDQRPQGGRCRTPTILSIDLTQEVIDEPGTANDQTITYTYDAVGNRTLMNRNGVGTTYGYDANDRLLTETSGGLAITSTYDNNGNMKTRGNGTSTDSYTYDAENRLVSAAVQTGRILVQITYTYDADGMRTSKTIGGTTTTFLLDKNPRLCPSSCRNNWWFGDHLHIWKPTYQSDTDRRWSFLLSDRWRTLDTTTDHIGGVSERRLHL